MALSGNTLVFSSASYCVTRRELDPGLIGVFLSVWLWVSSPQLFPVSAEGSSAEVLFVGVAGLAAAAHLSLAEWLMEEAQCVSG